MSEFRLSMSQARNTLQSTSRTPKAPRAKDPRTKEAHHRKDWAWNTTIEQHYLCD